jgi:hypothetical protein
MATVTIKQIANAINDTLGTATGIVRSEAQDELSEGITDVPLLQVYWAGLTVSAESETDRITFGDDDADPTRYTQHIFHVDVVASFRQHLDQDMEAIADTCEAVITVFEAENAPPYFGLAGIKAFSYTAEPIGWENIDPQAVGERFIITISLF